MQNESSQLFSEFGIGDQENYTLTERSRVSDNPFTLSRLCTTILFTTILFSIFFPNLYAAVQMNFAFAIYVAALQKYLIGSAMFDTFEIFQTAHHHRCFHHLKSSPGLQSSPGLSFMCRCR